MFGMRAFSVQNPMVRGFQGAPLFYATLKHYGILAPRYKLVNLIVNGNDIGIMSLEEHFSKELLESQGRKESVIVKYDESLVWAAQITGESGRQRLGLGGHFDNYHLMNIDGFGSKKISESKQLSNDYQIAVGMLRAFTDGTMAPSEVFDVKLMARFMAVSELWGSWHSLSWRNLRFYYNPITARLEPIGNDPGIEWSSAPGKNEGEREPITSVMRAALLDDPVLFAEFKQSVKTIKDEIESGVLFSILDEVETELLPILRKEFFLIQAVDRKKLEQRIALIDGYSKHDFDKFYQIHYGYPELIQAYKIESPDSSYIEIANITPSLVDIIAINWVPRKNRNNLKAVEFVSDTSLPMVLQPTNLFGHPKYYRIYFENNLNFEKDYQLEIVSRAKGSEKLVSTQVRPYFERRSHNPVPISTLEQQLREHHEYLGFDKSRQIMSDKKGRMES